MSKKRKASIDSAGGPIFLDQVNNKGSISGRGDVNRRSSKTSKAVEPAKVSSTGEPKPMSSKIWLTGIIIVALIGCVGTIIAALVGILPQLLKPTSFPSLAPTSISNELMLVPSDSQQPNPETSTFPTDVPSPPPPSNTSPGTVLEVGQIWQQDGLEIILQNTELKNYGGQYGIEGAINFELYLTNRNPRDITVSYHYAIDNSITALDNFGNSLKIWNYYVGLPGDPCDKQTTTVPSNETVNLSCGQAFIAQVDIGNSSITEIVVVVSGISNISNARWRIPVYH